MGRENFEKKSQVEVNAASPDQLDLEQDGNGKNL